MRELPSAQLKKSTDFAPSFHASYDVVSDQDARLFGHVVRKNGPGSREQRPWKGYVLATAGEYGSGLHVANGTPFRTRQEALMGVLHAWQAQEAELDGHAIEEAVQAGIRMAERHAAQQVEKDPGHRLTATQYRDRAFSVSTRVVIEELKTERDDLRNRLKGLKPAMTCYLQHNAYMIRMYELELVRRSPSQPLLNVRQPRCEAQARKGTGTGTCDAVLDERGNCLRARNHIEVN